MIKHFLMRALRNSVILGCVLLFFSTPLKPILDGRTNPIYVESTYTFTDGEWARGWVYFLNGIVVPAGITAHLAVIPEIPGIDMQGTGCIILEDDLVFSQATAEDGLFFNGGIFQASGRNRFITLTQSILLTYPITIQGSYDIWLNLGGNFLESGVAGTGELYGAAEPSNGGFSYATGVGFNILDGLTLSISNGYILDLADYDQGPGGILAPFFRSTPQATGTFYFSNGVKFLMRGDASCNASLFQVGGDLTMFPQYDAKYTLSLVGQSAARPCTYLDIGGTTPNFMIDQDCTLSFSTNSALTQGANSVITLNNGTLLFADPTSGLTKIMTGRFNVGGSSYMRSIGYGSSNAVIFGGGLGAAASNINILPGSSLVFDGINVRHDM